MWGEEHAPMAWLGGSYVHTRGKSHQQRSSDDSVQGQPWQWAPSAHPKANCSLPACSHLRAHRPVCVLRDTVPHQGTVLGGLRSASQKQSSGLIDATQLVGAGRRGGGISPGGAG